LPASLASSKTTVEKLIRRFESDRPHYLSWSYFAAQARVDFMTPFFSALGWDVENEEAPRTMRAKLSSKQWKICEAVPTKDSASHVRTRDLLETVLWILSSMSRMSGMPSVRTSG